MNEKKLFFREMCDFFCSEVKLFCVFECEIKSKFTDWIGEQDPKSIFGRLHGSS